MDEVCNISNKYRPTRIHDPPSFRKKIGALHSKRFSKHPVFTTFPFTFKRVSQACNILNKYCFLNKSAKETFLHKTTYTLPSFQK